MLVFVERSLGPQDCETIRASNLGWEAGAAAARAAQ